MPKYKLSDPIGELGAVLPGDVLERLRDMASDPGADMSIGRQARFAQALIDTGELLMTLTKDEIAHHIRGGVGQDAVRIEDGTVFQWRKGSKRTIVDSAMVKREFPIDECPEYYKTSEGRDSISVTFEGR